MHIILLIRRVVVGAGSQLRVAVRAHYSSPIIQRIECALVRFKSGKHYLPQSLLGIAIDYELSHWITRQVYLQDGGVEIDHNLVENAIRPTALGKKNWLLIGDAAASERSAIFYSLIEN